MSYAGFISYKTNNRELFSNVGSEKYPEPGQVLKNLSRKQRIKNKNNNNIKSLSETYTKLKSSLPSETIVIRGINQENTINSSMSASNTLTNGVPQEEYKMYQPIVSTSTMPSIDMPSPVSINKAKRASDRKAKRDRRNAQLAMQKEQDKSDTDTDKTQTDTDTNSDTDTEKPEKPRKHRRKMNDTEDNPPKMDDTEDKPKKHWKMDDTEDKPKKHWKMDDTEDKPKKHWKMDDTEDKPKKHWKMDDTEDKPKKHWKMDDTEDKPKKHWKMDDTEDKPKKHWKMDDTEDKPKKDEDKSSDFISIITNVLSKTLTSLLTTSPECNCKNKPDNGECVSCNKNNEQPKLHETQCPQSKQHETKQHEKKQKNHLKEKDEEKEDDSDDEDNDKRGNNTSTIITLVFLLSIIIIGLMWYMFFCDKRPY